MPCCLARSRLAAIPAIREGRHRLPSANHRADNRGGQSTGRPVAADHDERSSASHRLEEGQDPVDGFGGARRRVGTTRSKRSGPGRGRGLVWPAAAGEQARHPVGATVAPGRPKASKVALIMAGRGRRLDEQHPPGAARGASSPIAPTGVEAEDTGAVESAPSRDRSEASRPSRAGRWSAGRSRPAGRRSRRSPACPAMTRVIGRVSQRRDASARPLACTFEFGRSDIVPAPPHAARCPISSGVPRRRKPRGVSVEGGI